MAKNDKINMPSSGAGITQYFNEFTSKIQIKPVSVIILIIVVALLVLALQIFANGFFEGL